MAGKRLVNYLTNRYQQGGIVEKQKALAMSPEALAIEEQWKANEARDWDTGLAEALTDILSTPAGSMPQDVSGMSVTDQAKGLVDWTKSRGQDLGAMGKLAGKALAGGPGQTPFQRSVGGDFGWLNELAGDNYLLDKMIKMLNPTAHDAINSVIEENKMLEGSQLGGKVVEEDEWLDSEGNIVRPFRQPEHGNYAPVQSLP